MKITILILTMLFVLRVNGSEDPLSIQTPIKRTIAQDSSPAMEKTRVVMTNRTYKAHLRCSTTQGGNSLVLGNDVVVSCKDLQFKSVFGKGIVGAVTGKVYASGACDGQNVYVYAPITSYDKDCYSETVDYPSLKNYLDKDVQNRLDALIQNIKSQVPIICKQAITDSSDSTLNKIIREEVDRLVQEKLNQAKN